MAATATLTRARKTSGDGVEERWILSGPAGAVEYNQLKHGMALGIEVHSRDPLYTGDEPDADCRVFDGHCYPSAGSAAATELQRRHAEARFDDEVIWAELAEWYAQELAGTEAAA